MLSENITSATMKKPGRAVTIRQRIVFIVLVRLYANRNGARPVAWEKGNGVVIFEGLVSESASRVGELDGLSHTLRLSWNSKSVFAPSDSASPSFRSADRDLKSAQDQEQDRFPKFVVVSINERHKPLRTLR